MNRALLAAFALVTAGCPLGKSPLTEVLPDDRIQINLPLASSLSKADDKNWATFYLFTADVTEEVNTLIAIPLYWLDTITTRYPPSYVDSAQNEATWGPWDDGPLDPALTQLQVQHDTTTDIYTWNLDRWAKESTVDDATAVVAGEVDPGATRDVSSGRFSIDFTANHAIDPTDEGTGLFYVDYDIMEDGVAATATFEDFGPDVLDASYAYEQVFEGSGSMTLSVGLDVNGNGVMETLYIHSRWEADGSGRADVIVAGGDLADTQAQASECWSTSFERSWYTDNYSGLTEGDEATCVYTDAAFPEVTGS